jgi:uncharacterized protein (TIGR02246 family)
VDRDKKPPKQSNPGSAGSDPAFPRGSEMEALYRKLQPEMRHPRPGQDAMAAAMEAVQRLAAEVDVDDASDAVSPIHDPAGQLCRVCGHRNRDGNKFCSMCGLLVESAGREADLSADAYQSSEPMPFLRPAYADGEPSPRSAPRPAPGSVETHHYHHHYHHHYFPAGHENGAAPPRASADARGEPDRARVPASARGESMSRAEAAVRRITQEWVLACNTKHLDDLLELYSADALVLRSNFPPVRGAAAIREFFFGVLDAGLGEVEVDPLRVEVIGDIAYEAGRCKALVPGAAGKRREERGKYLWVFSRSANGEWKLVSDCWSSDLTLGAGESDVPSGQAIKASPPPRKSV